MSKQKNNKPESALEALKEILTSGVIGTQETLKEELEKRGLQVTQSTISRSLQKLSAIKSFSPSGDCVYRLQAEEKTPSPMTPFNELIMDITHNDNMVIVRTSPGSASLVARSLDHYKPGGIVGTIAGDDTIFVAPPLKAKMKNVVSEIRRFANSSPA